MHPAQAAPKPIDASEFDAVSGQVNWPELLRGDAFKQQRALVDQLLVKQAHYGKFGVADHEQVVQALESMIDRLRDMINTIPTQEYINAKNFLKSLTYGITKSQLS